MRHLIIFVFNLCVQKTLSRKKRSVLSSSEWSRSFIPSTTSDSPPTIVSQMTDDVNISYAHNYIGSKFMYAFIFCNLQVFFDRLSSDNGDQGIKQEVVDFGGNYDNSSRLHYKKTHPNFRRYSSWQRNPSRRVEDDRMPNIGMSRIWGRVLDRAFDNSDRRQYGMGFIGRLCRYFCITIQTI